MAIPRLVTYDPETKSLRVDGVSQVRPVDAEVRAPPNRGAQASGRRQSTCGQCGETGHTRQKCGQQSAASSQESGTAAMVRSTRKVMN
jgi:hypothetical protein